MTSWARPRIISASPAVTYRQFFNPGSDAWASRPDTFDALGRAVLKSRLRCDYKVRKVDSMIIGLVVIGRILRDGLIVVFAIRSSLWLRIAKHARREE